MNQVLKRDCSLQAFERSKIANAIFKAAQACGGSDRQTSEHLALQVEEILNQKFFNKVPAVVAMQNILEKFI